MRLLALILVFLLPCSAAASELSLQHLLASVAKHGPGVTARRLFESPRDWKHFLKRISTGEPAYLILATALRPGTDAGSSSMLDNAVLLALGEIPAAVLEMLGTEFHAEGFIVRRICSANIAIDYSDDESLRLIQQRISILQNLHNSNVKTQKIRCLASLEKAAKSFQQ